MPANRDLLVRMAIKTKECAEPAKPPKSPICRQCGKPRNIAGRVIYTSRQRRPSFGEGPKNAPMMLVGEQPGDYEDVAGKPFVGPAGKIMNRALQEAGIDRRFVSPMP